MAASYASRDVSRSSMLPSVTYSPITWIDGDELLPVKIVQLWKDGSQDIVPESRKKIERARDFRRGTLRVQISPSWAARYPDIAQWVMDTSTMPERKILEQDQIARTAAVEPELIRKPTGKLERDKTNARKLQAYIEEWRQGEGGPPHADFIAKGIEDGQYARVTIPSDADIDGIPDFYERLDQDAYDALEDDQKAEYKQDEADRIYQKNAPKRYARFDSKGNKLYGQSYERDAKGKTRFEAGKDASFRPDYGKSKQAHDEIVRDYLLQRQASNTRLIPALDCIPFFTRGKGRSRWELLALIERSLFYAEELLEQGLSWVGMGDRGLIPKGYASGRLTGQNNQFYLYTVYTVCTDDQGHRRPIVAYCVGGLGTSSGSIDPGSESCAIIDLYARYGLEGPLWSYHWGSHGADDDPDFYAHPYLDPMIETMMSMEGTAMSIRAANALNCFTGYVYQPDSKLAEVAPESLLETDGATLKRPKVPEAGEIDTAAGVITPFSQARVGEDAWRLQALEMQSLVRNTQASQVPTGSDPSGHALVVGASLAQVAQRQTRESALEAVVRAGEDHLKILDAVSRMYDVNWPLQTRDDLTEDIDPDSVKEAVEFDPAWVEGGHYELTAEYPPEENLARRDMEMAAADRGWSNYERVAKESGEKDAFNFMVKNLKTQMWRDPANMLRLKNLVAKERGDEVAQQIYAMQAKGQQTPDVQIPGFEQGVPQAAMAGAGQPQPGPGGPTAGASARGGQQSAEMQAAQTSADDLARIQVQPSAAVTGGR